MRFIKLVAVLCCVSCVLCGCTQMRQVENQAYILTLGIDRNEDSQIELTVQTPKIATSSELESSAAEGGNGNYFNFSAKGDDFHAALQRLEWIIPRMLNLSHLKLIVLSEELAFSEECQGLLGDIAHTERLFSAARVVVCAGKASDFISDLKPVIGSRLSTDILSTFDHYIAQGFIPDGNLAELYYRTQSVYSDPMCAYGVLSDVQSAESAPAAAQIGSEATANTKSEIKTHYIGAAVFSEGVCRTVFTPSQTLCAGLLKGTVKMFRYAHDGQGLEIFPSTPVRVSIALEREPIDIRVSLGLSVSAQEDAPDLDSLKQALQENILSTIHAAQRAGVEPFDFADAAAKRFSTLEKWMDFDWRNQFSEANVAVALELRHVGA